MKTIGLSSAVNIGRAIKMGSFTIGTAIFDGIAQFFFFANLSNRRFDGLLLIDFVVEGRIGCRSAVLAETVVDKNRQLNLKRAGKHTQTAVPKSIDGCEHAAVEKQAFHCHTSVNWKQ
ncbi:uncharacterized protein UDID_17273 [Ustilago sp. UG-2017a]|nr:uncharacterized protein UDID_17273 [Ustilago sp. UG-2017a]